MMDDLAFVSLHDLPAGAQTARAARQLAEFLSSHWPRSVEARVQLMMNAPGHVHYLMLRTRATAGNGAHTGDEDGRVVAACKLSAGTRVRRSDGRDTLSVCILESLLVAEQMRGVGLGRRMVDHAERTARALGFPAVFLCTADQHAFYTRLGYKESREFVCGTKGAISSEKAEPPPPSPALLPAAALPCAPAEVALGHPRPAAMAPAPPPPPVPPPPVPFEAKYTWFGKDLD